MAGALGDRHDGAVRFVGVDLAWSPTGKGRTGLCIADEDGAVLASTSRRRDDEIVEWLAPWCEGPVLVGFDAPITVPNAHGRRRCDALVSHAFGPEEAGVYPANRGNPAFGRGTRAEGLAARLGLDLDPYLEPRAGAVRTALETYPHSASVALFGLPRTLKYKARPGRPLADRLGELDHLLDLLESLRSFDPPLDVAASPRWPTLRAEVRSAPTKAALSRAEDEVDAHVCAYVCLYYWVRGHGDRCRVIGDRTAGHIVTPVGAVHVARLATRPTVP